MSATPPPGKRLRIGGSPATLAALVLAGCSGSMTVGPRGGDQGTITASVAASVGPAMAKIAARFERDHSGVTVRVNRGASGALARQIAEGAPVDLLLTADDRTMDQAAATGRLLPGSRVPLLSNRLVFAVPQDSTLSVRQAEDLAGPEIDRVALCPDSVPVGHYARQWLSSRNLLDSLEPRAVRPENARAALALVEAGSVDGGFLYRTDAAGSARVRVAFEIPPSETAEVVYPAATVRDGPNPDGGRELLAFLEGAEARAIFEEAGFPAARAIP